MKTRSGKRRVGLIGGLVAAFGLVALVVVSVAIASTYLHQSTPISWEEFQQECKGDENLAPGTVLWHFVLTQTAATQPQDLMTSWEDGNGDSHDKTTASSKKTGSTIHWNVVTPDDYVLMGAVTPADGKLLNLSHVCGGNGVTDQFGWLDVKKFYDANANGVKDDGDYYLDGWKVNITPPDEDVFTPYNAQVPIGWKTVTEYPSLVGCWVASTDTSFTVEVKVNETTYVEFGNYCKVRSGGKTPGYWSNRNGEATMNDGGTMAPELQLLRDLNLRTAGGANFDPTTYTQFRSWLLGGEATNMAYMLSVHLAAMALNVEAGFVSPDAFVLGFDGTISELMDAANTSLGLHGYTPAGDPARPYQETLKNYLDYLNNNGYVVPPTACPYAFELPS